VGEPPAAGARAILLDIEGTTTPIAFVSQVLFPYARTRLRSTIDHQIASGDALLTRLHDEQLAASCLGEPVPAWTEDPEAARAASAVAYAEWLMDRDRKSTALKELQGLIWQDGYRSGELRGEVFPDVPRALRRWREHAFPVFIFSSGSVLAQRLLFEHSSAGDLTSFLQSFFDTNVGAKIAPESYRRIATRVGCPAESILFLSDALPELDAARDAGLQVRLVVRPGNVPITQPHGYAVVHSFDEVAFTSPID
jgi:enolase-phosphatase E1